MRLDWLIIGGGIHGVHIAARLLGDADISRDRLRIVDPGDCLLSSWRNCTATTGMTHLRSSSVHHLGLHHAALQRFAGRNQRTTRRPFAPPFERPSLSLFNAHCDHVEATYRLRELHLRTRATRCSIRPHAVEVQLEDDRTLEAGNIVLAIGSSEQPRWPDWAPRNDPRIHHIYTPGFDGWPTRRERVTVVGGGISSGHVALRLVQEGHDVHLVSRHGIRQHQFDSDSGWLGWRYSATFSRERDPDRRRGIVTEARHHGSVPPDMARSLRRAINRRQLTWHQGEIDHLVEGPDGMKLVLDEDTAIEAHRVLLATGFDSRRPGGIMIDKLIESGSLPCAECGYPIVDTELRWHPRIYVSGPLAELELGPVSRNIAGARRAGDRIIDSVRSHSHAVA